MGHVVRAGTAGSSSGGAGASSAGACGPDLPSPGKTDGLYLDGDALLAPASAVADVGHELAQLLADLHKLSESGAVFGDSGTAGAWDQYHVAWISETTAVQSAVDEVAKLVVKSSSTLEATDEQSARKISAKGNSS
jgi:hypothetical protein